MRAAILTASAVALVLALVTGDTIVLVAMAGGAILAVHDLPGKALRLLAPVISERLSDGHGDRGGHEADHQHHQHPHHSQRQS